MTTLLTVCKTRDEAKSILDNLYDTLKHRPLVYKDSTAIYVDYTKFMVIIKDHIFSRCCGCSFASVTLTFPESELTEEEKFEISYRIDRK